MIFVSKSTRRWLNQRPVEEIRDEEHDRAPPQGPHLVLEHGREVAPALRGLGGDKLAHDAQDVLPALPRAQVQARLLAEEDEADAVLVPHRDEGDQGAELRRDLALRPPAA